MEPGTEHSVSNVVTPLGFPVLLYRPKIDKATSPANNFDYQDVHQLHHLLPSDGP